MAYVARQRLRWGDGDIEIGDPVPEGEEGRDYESLVRLGQIAEVNAIGDVDEAVVRLTADRDQALEKVKAAETERDQAVKRAETAEAKLADTEKERDDALALLDEATGDGEPASEGEPPAATDPPAEDAPLPDDVKELGGGWYEVGTGADAQKVHGRAALDEYLANRSK